MPPVSIYTFSYRIVSMCINIILFLLSLIVALYKWANGRQNIVGKFNF